MAIGDVYRISAIWRSSTTAKTAVNNFYFKQATTLIFDTPEEDLAERFQADFLTAYVQLVTSNLVMDTLLVGKSPDFFTSLILTGLGQGGQLSGDALSPRDSGIIAYQTATPGRRGRGRIYLPPATESQNGNGKPAAGYLTLMQSFIDEWIAMDDENVLYARWTPQMWSHADQVSRDITSFARRTFWGSQRDRGRLY